MRNYDAKNIEAFFRQNERHITHLIVAHTHFRPFQKTQAQIHHYARQAKKDLRHALNHFGRLLYPNASNRVRRNPSKYAPLTFVTLEGAHETTNQALTLHFNISLGNLPKILNTDDITVLFSHAWHIEAHQSDDIKAYEYKANRTNTWLGYQLKEAQQIRNLAWDDNGIWDVENCWIPHAALSAD